MMQALCEVHKVVVNPWISHNLINWPSFSVADATNMPFSMAANEAFERSVSISNNGSSYV